MIKFYHFKRKVKDVQNQNTRSSSSLESSKNKPSRIVHNILNIVENYTEKCSISSIRIDESNKKLIIESKNTQRAGNKTSPATEPFEFIPELKGNVVNIKKEQGLLEDESEIMYSEHDNRSIATLNESEFDDNTQYDDFSEPANSSTKQLRRHRAISERQSSVDSKYY